MYKYKLKKVINYCVTWLNQVTKNVYLVIVRKCCPHGLVGNPPVPPPD